MTANELADGILAVEERIFLTKKEHQLFQNSATMLRQQQAEIESFLENTNTAGRVLPVYTHQMRELTDEQMLEVYKKVFNKQNEFKENLKRRSYFDFARAILKKASEK